MPLIHKPSFMSDLAAGEEERNPIFFALILQMISMTLIHVRAAQCPVDVALMFSFPSRTFQSQRKMFEQFRTDVCEEQMPSRIEMPSDWCWTCVLSSMSLLYLSSAANIRFFMFVVHNKRGDVGLEAATFGEAQYIAICLGMHREDVSMISVTWRPTVLILLVILQPE
jgi:hypothetical protein